MTKANSGFPLVYSCSGCSSAAQMANHVALQLDRRGAAEMSCIAGVGVGGDVPSLMKTARSGRPIIALDGCPLACVKSALGRHGIVARWHFQLNDLGVKKKYHADFDPVQAQAVVHKVAAALAVATATVAADLAHRQQPEA